MLRYGLLLSLVVVSTLAGQTGETQFWTIAEGYTAGAQEDGMHLAWRMFSAPDRICEGVPSSMRLKAHVSPATAVVGEPFDLNSLAITAIDPTGFTIGPVPVAVQVHAPHRALDIDQYRAGLGPIIPVMTGRWTLRVQSLCSADTTEVLIEVTVVSESR